jgi:hypothetical protein
MIKRKSNPNELFMAQLATKEINRARNGNAEMMILENRWIKEKSRVNSNSKAA